VKVLAEKSMNCTPGPVVEAPQAMRGAVRKVGAGMIAETGDMRRCDHPRHLMAFLGLVPGGRSRSSKRKRKWTDIITKLAASSRASSSLEPPEPIPYPRRSGEDAALAADRNIDPRYCL
jgi:Transposase IS116/IS110/IS902 family